MGKNIKLGPVSPPVYPLPPLPKLPTSSDPPPTQLMKPNPSYPGEPFTPPFVSIPPMPTAESINPATGEPYTPDEILALEGQYQKEAWEKEAAEQAKEDQDNTTEAGETPTDDPSGDFSASGDGGGDDQGDGKAIPTEQTDTSFT
jgi:hypothetical protein